MSTTTQPVTPWHVLVITFADVRLYNVDCDCHKDGHEETTHTSTEVRGLYTSREEAEAALPVVIEVHELMSADNFGPERDYDPTGCSDPEYVTEKRVTGQVMALTARDDF